MAQTLMRQKEKSRVLQPDNVAFLIQNISFDFSNLVLVEALFWICDKRHRNTIRLSY